MTDDKIILSGIPTPPTHNKCYFPFLVRSGKKMIPRLAPSKDLTAFKRAFGIWSLTQQKVLEEAKFKMRLWFLDGKQVSIHAMMVGPQSVFYTKTGSVRKMDVENRMKPLHDCIFDALGFDDAEIFYSSCEKLITETEREYFLVHISPHTPRRMLDLS